MYKSIDLFAISEKNITEYNILLAGFPYQAFSLAR